jgi:hypothetical protein
MVLSPFEAAVADAQQGCQSSESPHFTFGFADLKMQIGDAMGDPVTCEFSDPNGTGDVHQRTTTGLAFWRKSTNTATFTNGFEHWAVTHDGLVTWTGSSVDPPATATANAYPPVLVDAFTSSCESRNPNDPQLTATCGCAIQLIQQTYSLGDFINLAVEIEQQGTLPPELANIVVQCALQQLTQ